LKATIANYFEEVATKIVALEQGHNGNTAWGTWRKFSTWHDARRARNERFAEVLLRWGTEHTRLKELVLTLLTEASHHQIWHLNIARCRHVYVNLKNLVRHLPLQSNRMFGLRLKVAERGVRALTFENFALNGLTEPFNFEVFMVIALQYLGKNGTGKSHFLRLIGGDQTVKYSW
jgi:ATPase subunit of ABC transporter with duplicated ATPase domains